MLEMPCIINTSSSKGIQVEAGVFYGTTLYEPARQLPDDLRKPKAKQLTKSF